MNTLTHPQKIQHRHSDYLIKLVHQKVEIEADLEMRASIRLEFWTKDENGDFDQPVLDVIASNETLTQNQKRNDMETFRTRIWSSSTRGSWVNPATGDLVFPDEHGAYPEGSITQLEYWQNIPADMFPGATLAERVYAGILLNMQQIYDLQNI